MWSVKHKCGHCVMTVAMCFLVRCITEANKARPQFMLTYVCCHGSQSMPVEKCSPKIQPLGEGNAVSEVARKRHVYFERGPVFTMKSIILLYKWK